MGGTLPESMMICSSVSKLLRGLRVLVLRNGPCAQRRHFGL